jgi:hypothetical protein
MHKRHCKSNESDGNNNSIDSEFLYELAYHNDCGKIFHTGHKYGLSGFLATTAP